MIKNSGVFVKINYSNDLSIKDRRNHKARGYKGDNLAKYVLCGGVYNRNGGTIIFHASTFKEAEHIVNNNPFKESKNYSFEILSKNYINLATVQ